MHYVCVLLRFILRFFFCSFNTEPHEALLLYRCSVFLTMKLLPILAIFLASCQVQARAVFAHFMVTNSAKFSLGDWETDITYAQEAHIDAFALNMAYDDPANGPGLANAFTAANNLGFQLFFSFDYAGNGPWPQADVINLITEYSSNAAYYQYNGQPFVSTFEGPANAYDWITIKAQTGCFFIPDWVVSRCQACSRTRGGRWAFQLGSMALGQYRYEYLCGCFISTIP
ncbi:hypothetical protein VTN77DRAFT_8778 [Rasamsonia byssochlamydoides]|uniref:uncharacterized protein n=1 Tax=Rasamsonia byssochlamydoides TaxID=89139 RepID=UPI003742CB0D